MQCKLIFLLLFFVSSLCNAQPSQLIFQQFNRSNGLPADAVTCLAQDKTGFIWIGSREGLFRFDGFTYKEFYHLPSKRLSLPNNYVSTIYVDANGLLWVGTMGGLALMQNDGNVLDVLNSESSKAFTKFSDNISDIRKINDLFWISTGEGLFSVQLQQKKLGNLRKYDLRKTFSFSTNALGLMQVDGQGKLWIGTMKGMVIFDPRKNLLQHKSSNPDQLPVLNEEYATKTFYLDTINQKLWYANWQPSMKLYDLRTKEVTTISTGTSAKPQYEQLANCFLKDKQQRLWIATGEGLKYVSGNGPSIEGVIESRDDNPFGLKHPVVSALLQDKDGLLWTGTLNGISVANPYRQEVTNIALHNSHHFPFGKEQVNAVMQADENTLLAGTYNSGGVYVMDLAFNLKKKFQTGDFKKDWVWRFYRYGKNILVTAQGSNLLYDVKAKSLTVLQQPPFNRFYPVSSVVSVSDTMMWISRYYNDFLYYNPSTRRFKKRSLSSLGEEPTIIHLAPDTDSTIWIIADNQGLLRFHTGKEKIIERILPGENGLLQSQIMFVKDAGNWFLIGYVSKGLSLYHKKQKTFTHFSRADGLVSNSVSDAFVKDNIAWITTTNGISRFDLNTKAFATYNQNKGILENDFQCITSLSDGRMVAGSTRGLVYFNPRAPQTKAALPPPVITEVAIQGRSASSETWTRDTRFSIPYDQNDFSFEYISFDYANHRHIEYAYKLEGHDEDWIMAGNRRFASYSNMKGGDYQFRVKARLAEGPWVESVQPVPLFVGTAFYRQWWFYALCTLLCVSIGYAFYRYRIRQLLRFEKMRSDISSDLHDEVGATLSSISLFSEMARQAEPANTKTEQYLKRIGERSRESIEKMSDIVWSIHPENDSLQQLLARMKNHVNELFEDRDVNVHWQEGNLHHVKLNMQQRRNMYLLFKEAVSNAAKYAGAKNISILLQATDRTLVLQIKDDGRGFDFQQVRLGNGIRNMKQRAASLNASFEINSSLAEGTCVYLKITR